jgi:glycosyltransferase involved in cell wall biosynthesis
MELPRLSVIIPNYNHGHCLPVAVESLLKQSVPPDEIIIVDDGSTDNSVVVIESLVRRYPQIQFYRNEKNLGVCPTVNRGIDMAKGEYVFLSGADDQTLPGFLEKSLQLLARHPEAGLSCTVGDWHEVATGLNWHMGVGMVDKPSYLSPEQMLGLERRGRFYIPGHTAIMKRSALIEAGKLIPELRLVVDWFTNYVIGFRHGICVVPEPLAVFKIFPDAYYKRNRRDKQIYRSVLEFMLTLLNQPKFQDSAEFIRQAGSLYIFGAPMLGLLVSRSEFRRFLTPVFLRKNLWYCTKLVLKRIVPAFLGNLYFRISGYRAKSKPASGH